MSLLEVITFFSVNLSDELFVFLGIKQQHTLADGSNDFKQTFVSYFKQLGELRKLLALTLLERTTIYCLTIKDIGG